MKGGRVGGFREKLVRGMVKISSRVRQAGAGGTVGGQWL